MAHKASFPHLFTKQLLSGYSMHKQLRWQDTLALGLLMFSLFLGAGNIIFPPMAGKLAGTSIWPALIGFLITAVVLPLLGIIAIAKQGQHFTDLCQDLPKPITLIIGLIIYLCLGPLFGLPRLSLVTQEVAIKPFFTTSNSAGNWQWLTSLVFFSIACFYALKPGQLLEKIGRFIAPALVLMLLIVAIATFWFPLGKPGPVAASYQHSPFTTGFIEGYFTLDALAAMVFGGVIINSLNQYSITSRHQQMRYSFKAAAIAAIGLALVYLTLFYLGATSHEALPNSNNGGKLFADYVFIQLGWTGRILIAGVAMLACLTTAIGGLSGIADYFTQQFTLFSYSRWVILLTLACIGIAQLPLNELIQWFAPILIALYPLAILLILHSFIHSLLIHPKLTLRATLLITACFSTVDALIAAKLFTAPHWYTSLPLASYQFTWLLPAVVSLLLIHIVTRVYTSNWRLLASTIK